MTKLVRFLDDDRKGRWANILMDNGDPCWVSIAQSGILIKKSKTGLFGAKLFNGDNIYKAAKTAMDLRTKYPQDITPTDMRNPILKSVVNVILHCNNLAQVTIIFNETYNASG